MKEKLKDLWGLDSPLLSFFEKIGWVFLLNVLFIVTSIPVVTIGASATAMYTVLFKLIDEREFSLIKDYFRAWKEGFGKSTVVWMIVLVAGLILGIDIMYVFTQMSGAFGIAMKCGTVILAVVFCMFANILFPMLSQFELSIKEMFTTAFQLMMENMLLTLESLLFTVIIFGGCLLIVYSGFFWGFFIVLPFISFGLHAMMQSYVYRRMFGLEPVDDEEEFDEEFDEKNE